MMIEYTLSSDINPFLTVKQDWSQTNDVSTVVGNPLLKRLFQLRLIINE